MLACAWFAALIPAAFLLHSGTEESVSAAGVVTRSSTTFVGSDGLWVVTLLAVPLVLGIVVWIGLRRRCTGKASRADLVVWLPLGALLAFALISAASIGLLLLPGALTLAAAAAATPVGTRPV